MPVDNKFTRCEEDNPNRCKGVDKSGQCPYLAEKKPETDEFLLYCWRHGANKTIQSLEKEALNNYRLSKYKARIQHFSSNPSIKSLREEIGILRMVMEEILNKAHDSDDLLLFSPKIGDLVLKIEKVVSSCHRLELSAGELLDKTTVINLADQIVSIIGTQIENAETVENIAKEIMKIILDLKIGEKEKEK